MHGPETLSRIAEVDLADRAADITRVIQRLLANPLEIKEARDVLQVLLLNYWHRIKTTHKHDVIQSLLTDALVPELTDSELLGRSENDSLFHQLLLDGVGLHITSNRVATARDLVHRPILDGIGIHTTIIIDPNYQRYAGDVRFRSIRNVITGFLLNQASAPERRLRIASKTFKRLGVHLISVKRANFEMQCIADYIVHLAMILHNQHSVVVARFGHNGMRPSVGGQTIRQLEERIVGNSAEFLRSRLEGWIQFSQRAGENDDVTRLIDALERKIEELTDYTTISA